MAGRVLVAGGTGFVGGELVRTLQRLNYEVIVISRSAESSQSVWRGYFNFLMPKKEDSMSSVQKISWDLVEEKGLPPRTVAVVNAAGQNVLDPLKRWNESFKQLVYDSRVNTNKILSEAIEKAEEKPQAFVTMSGVGFYPSGGDSEGGYTELSDGGSGNFLSSLVSDWEAAANISSSLTGVRRCSIRSGVVLGRNGGMIQQLFLPFYLGLGGHMGRGSQIMPWVHVKDVARLIVHCIQTPECAGIYNAVAPQSTTNKQFAKAFASALWRPAFFPVPEFVFNLVFGKERAAMITDSQWVRPERTLESGFEFHYPSILEACQEFAHLMYVDPDQ